VVATPSLQFRAAKCVLFCVFYIVCDGKESYIANMISEIQEKEIQRASGK
jgi:hypothetical protein